MMTQFRIGNPDGAIQAGRHALELNPNNPRTMAKLAFILFVTGHWEEGAGLARAGPPQGESLDDVETILAFDAYRRGQFAQALQHLQQVNRPDCYCVQILEVATLGQLGRNVEAEAAIADLHRKRPQFEDSFEAELASRSFTPSLITLLKAGLEKAGLKVA
jgi:Flp pilus assembly protein TadD